MLLYITHNTVTQCILPQRPYEQRRTCLNGWYMSTVLWRKCCCDLRSRLPSIFWMLCWNSSSAFRFVVVYWASVESEKSVMLLEWIEKVSLYSHFKPNELYYNVSLICYAAWFYAKWECNFGGVMYLVFTCMPGGTTAGDLGLCCCVPCLLSADNSLVCWFMLS